MFVVPGFPSVVRSDGNRTRSRRAMLRWTGVFVTISWRRHTGNDSRFPSSGGGEQRRRTAMRSRDTAPQRSVNTQKDTTFVSISWLLIDPFFGIGSLPRSRQQVWLESNDEAPPQIELVCRRKYSSRKRYDGWFINRYQETVAHGQPGVSFSARECVCMCQTECTIHR